MKKTALLVVYIFGLHASANAFSAKHAYENTQASVAMMDEYGKIKYLSVSDVSDKIAQLRKAIEKERLELFIRMQKTQQDLYAENPHRMHIKQEIVAGSTIPDQYSRSAYLYSALCNFKDMVKHGFTGTYLIVCVGGEVLIRGVMPMMLTSAAQLYEYVKHNFEQMDDSGSADAEKEECDDVGKDKEKA